MKSTLRLLVDDSQIVLPVGSVGFALAGQDTSNWKPLISMRESDMRHQALYRNVPLRRSGSAAGFATRGPWFEFHAVAVMKLNNVRSMNK